MRHNRAGPPQWWPRMHPMDPKWRRGDTRDPTRRRQPMVRHETPPGQGGPWRSQRRPPGHGTRQKFLTDTKATKTRLKNRHIMHTFHAITGKVKKETENKKGQKWKLRRSRCCCWGLAGFGPHALVVVSCHLWEKSASPLEEKRRVTVIPYYQ